jgi:hypothetical protein
LAKIAEDMDKGKKVDYLSGAHGYYIDDKLSWHRHNNINSIMWGDGICGNWERERDIRLRKIRERRETEKSFNFL